jgi:hypothetical protein
MPSLRFALPFIFLTSSIAAQEPVKLPAWVQDTIGAGYTLSGMNTAQRTEAVKHGVTISELGFVDPFYPYYDSKLLKKRSPHVPLDRLQKEIAEYKRLGIRILGVYPPTLQGEVYETHLDWRRISTDTTTAACSARSGRTATSSSTSSPRS